MTTELCASAVLAFVTCITPGPNNALAAATGARFGGSAGLALALGARLQRWLDDARRRLAFNAVMALGLAGCAVATLAAAFDPSA